MKQTEKATVTDEKLVALLQCMEVVGGKWKPILLYCISGGKNRFNMLHKHVQGITKQMLSKQLKELEKSGLIERKVYAEVPPRVVYSLTAKGQSLSPVLQAMQRWGQKKPKQVIHASKKKNQQLPLFG
ncbi:winged helix-turn-helix transcriptional regulator [Maribacter sp. CXY002]|uniref:winged helix-turn-helix transcriptional regulator n=1 Tax=Maribacter luteocoastalis TaxID=3407671 RepID=UPI003B68162B